MDKENIPLYLAAQNVFGEDNQIQVAIEELGELIAAVMRNRRGRGTVPEVVEEIADAEIVLEQLKLFYGPHSVEVKKKEKLNRLKERVEKNKQW